HLLQHGARGGADLDDMADRWDDVIANLQTADVTRFLRHYLLIQQAAVRKDDVFDLFKTKVEVSGARALLEELLATSRWYGQFVNPNQADSPNERDVLEDLNTLRAVMCYTALLAARRFGVAEKDFVAFARLAETLTFRYSTICGRDAKDLERSYHVAAKALWESQGKDLQGARQALIAAMPGRDEFIAAFCTQVMGQKYIVDYTLRKLEAVLDPEEKATRGTTLVHVEHIMPQTLNDEWREVLLEHSSDHAAYVNRWGNLTLLGGKKNIKASNAAFATKCKIYQGSAIHLTQRLTQHQAWDFAAIDKRQLELAELADKAWPVPAQ
ncbi:MAG TPA: HNH endonuclease family protein, partial [Polyangiaceae bacterium]